jgi:hypothetical protein
MSSTDKGEGKGSSDKRSRSEDDKGSNKDTGVKRARGARGGRLVHIVEETRAWEDIWCVEYEEEDTIENIKLKLAQAMQGRKMVLSHKSGAILDDEATMQDCNIKHHARLYLSWDTGPAVMQP